jgi:hypothetical protein
VAELAIVSSLGDAWLDPDATGTPGVVHHRHFFHLRSTTPLPATWRHEERDPGDGGPPILFEFIWIPLADAPAVLIAGMGALAHLARV